MSFGDLGTIVAMRFARARWCRSNRRTNHDARPQRPRRADRDAGAQARGARAAGGEHARVTAMPTNRTERLMISSRDMVRVLYSMLTSFFTISPPVICKKIATATIAHQPGR